MKVFRSRTPMTMALRDMPHLLGWLCDSARSAVAHEILAATSTLSVILPLSL